MVIDAFSRKVVGWALDDHLEARLALAALDMAIAAREPPKGLIHHSDRGVQYACGAYSRRLADRAIEPSMSRPGNPYDHAKAESFIESFMKTLKAEEANGQTYADVGDARARIGAFIETVYNADRLHSALGYASPIAFEETLRKAETRKRDTVTASSINLSCLTRVHKEFQGNPGIFLWSGLVWLGKFGCAVDAGAQDRRPRRPGGDVSESTDVALSA